MVICKIKLDAFTLLALPVLLKLDYWFQMILQLPYKERYSFFTNIGFNDNSATLVSFFTALPAIMQYSFSPCPLLSKLSDLGMYLIAAVSAVLPAKASSKSMMLSRRIPNKKVIKFLSKFRKLRYYRLHVLLAKVKKSEMSF
ncbi:MAG: hypothetical protein V7K50_08945 [Nostoc sp.]|uniref:hypothetical protein n=1 Tax=Nostoc sp. TaxID=1180 RepID=UPI002FF75630